MKTTWPDSAALSVAPVSSKSRVDSLRWLKLTNMLAVVCLALLAFNAPEAYAWGGLQSQSISGFSRYCTYSDGGVLTVGSTELCPINNSGVFQNWVFRSIVTSDSGIVTTQSGIVTTDSDDRDHLCWQAVR